MCTRLCVFDVQYALNHHCRANRKQLWGRPPDIKTGLIRAVVLPCSNNESQHLGYSHSAGRNYIQPRLEIRTRHGSCLYTKQPETVRNITSHQQARRNRGHVHGRQQARNI
ncbi:unnamed protein product [Ectocarpus fasciculatus]